MSPLRGGLHNQPQRSNIACPSKRKTRHLVRVTGLEFTTARRSHAETYHFRRTSMSVHVSSWVWKHSKSRGGDRLVLLAIADMADDDRAAAWPSKETLAERAGLSIRQVKRCVANLVESGELVEIGSTRHGTKIYSVAGYLRGDILSPQGDVGDTGRVSSCHSEGDVGDTRTVIEPSVEPSRSAANVGIVYDHWREKRGKTRLNYHVISPERRKKIQSRLREFTVEDLCAAIDNVARDPWPDRDLHDDLTIIFKSREQVEKFLDMKTSSGRSQTDPHSSAEAWVKATGWQYPDADLWEELGRYELEPDQKRRLMILAANMQAKPVESFDLTGIVRDIP